MEVRSPSRVCDATPTRLSIRDVVRDVRFGRGLLKPYNPDQGGLAIMALSRYCQTTPLAVPCLKQQRKLSLLSPWKGFESSWVCSPDGIDAFKVRFRVARASNLLIDWQHGTPNSSQYHAFEAVMALDSIVTKATHPFTFIQVVIQLSFPCLLL